MVAPSFVMVTSPRSSTSILSRPIGPSEVFTTLATESAAVTARRRERGTTAVQSQQSQRAVWDSGGHANEIAECIVVWCDPGRVTAAGVHRTTGGPPRPGLTVPPHAEAREAWRRTILSANLLPRDALSLRATRDEINRGALRSLSTRVGTLAGGGV